jgi:phosphoribosyl-ATP pyrophosphohydrolase/phosphoribosyl-AMP cyclohydrolase
MQKRKKESSFKNNNFELSGLIEKLKFNNDGLIAAIAQDVKTKQVLMMAWMNKESLKLTFESGFATYFSRSRQKLWRKGETSGNVQKVIEIAADCDFDCLLFSVEQTGAACHTGSQSCFFNRTSILPNYQQTNF